MGATHQFQGLGRAGGPLGSVPDGSALHEQDRLQAVAAHQGGRQPQQISGLHLPEDGLKRGGGDVVAFIDDHLAVALHHGIHLPFAHQRLHHSDVELAGGFGLTPTDGTDRLWRDVQERLQPLLPLAQQFGPMHQHQGVHSTARQDRRRHHRFPEGCRRLQHADVVAQHRRHRRLLVIPQLTRECQLQW